MVKTVHWIKEYQTGDDDCPTCCGLTVSTWHDDPENEITSIETDLTCPECMKQCIAYLRPALDKMATHCNKLMDENWDFKNKFQKKNSEKIIDKVKDIINNEEEYPTAWDDAQVASIKNRIASAEAEGNVKPFHPLQLLTKSAVSETKKSLLKKIEEEFKNGT